MDIMIQYTVFLLQYILYNCTFYLDKIKLFVIYDYRLSILWNVGLVIRKFDTILVY